MTALKLALVAAALLALGGCVVDPYGGPGYYGDSGYYGSGYGGSGYYGGPAYYGDSSYYGGPGVGVSVGVSDAHRDSDRR